MGWTEKFFDRAFERFGKTNHLEDFIYEDDRVVGRFGDRDNVRGRAVKDQWDWMGTPTVKVQWDDGKTTTLPCDHVVSLA